MDDVADAAESMARLLSSLGHEAAYVTRSTHALKVAREMRPHLVFLDLGMPEIDGYALARLLRAEFGYDGMRLVAISGWGREEDRAASRQAGFDAHVKKPAGLDIIDSILKTVASPPPGLRS